MNAASIDIAMRLENSSLGLALAENLFVSTMPELPNRCVAVTDAGGERTDYSAKLESPTVQVRVRDLAYDDAYSFTKQIYDYLDKTTNLTLGAATYLHILAIGEPLFMGKDGGDRSLFSVNFRILRTY